MERVEQIPKPEKITDKLDAIVVLGARMQWHPVLKRWTFPTIIEDDPAKVVAGKSRAIAARQAIQENLAPVLLITGGYQEAPSGEQVSKAQELANLLTGPLQIPPEKVVVIGQEGSTWGNVEDTAYYLLENPQILQTGKIGILANKFHLLRAFQLFSIHQFFKEQQIKLIPLSAEYLLERRSSHYQSWSRKLYESAAMRTRLKLEKQGADALWHGTYKFGNASPAGL